MKKANLILALAIGLLFLASGAATADPKPSFDFDWYGCFKLDGAYDQNQTSHGNFVMWVNPLVNDEDDEQFNMTHKETRFGFTVNGQGYRDVRVNGNLEVDFYGSNGPENNALLNLRHAYFTVRKNSLQLLAGQTWDLVAPLDPPTLNYSVLWGCGNLGYRRPQITLGYISEPNDHTTVSFTGGFFRTIGDDLISLSLAQNNENEDGQDDGTDSGIPSFQGCFDYKQQWDWGGYFRVGVSGLYGTLKAESDQNNYDNYESWAAAVHCAYAGPGYGFSGEFYTGSNLGSYNGAIDRNSEVDGLESMGGWLAAWADLSPKFTFGTGFGWDNPNDEDFATGRSKNVCIYGNVKYALVPQATVGMEVAQWETSYKNADKATDLRVQTSFILNF